MTWMPKTFLMSYKPFGVSKTLVACNIYELAPFRHILVVQSLKMSGLAGAYHSAEHAGCVGWPNVPLKGAGGKAPIICCANEH